MNFPFDPVKGLVIVRAELEGPYGNVILRLALDTGATTTMINQDMLALIGYTPDLVSDRFQVTTGSSIVLVPRMTLKKITSLGQEKVNFPVLSHTLPPTAGVDGLLGLDFIRQQKICIDFNLGQITIISFS